MDNEGQDFYNPFVYNSLTKATLLTSSGSNPYFYQTTEDYTADTNYAIVISGDYVSFPEDTYTGQLTIGIETLINIETTDQ